MFRVTEQKNGLEVVIDVYTGVELRSGRPGVSSKGSWDCGRTGMVGTAQHCL